MSIIKKKRIEENVEGGTTFSTPPHFVPNSKQRYRKIVYVPGIQTLIGTTTSQPNSQHSFRWDNFLEAVRKQTNKDVRELPGSIFGNPPMGIFLSAITPGIKLEIRHYDYDTLFPDKKIFWIASVFKVVGYRLLMRYEGMDEPGDDRYDFWISLGSDELQHVGHCKFHNQTCDLLPPNSIRERHPDWSVYMAERLVKCKTLLANWEEERQIALVEGRFKVGTRLELLDRQASDSVRPARVIQQLGRRICVRVSSQDVNAKDLGDDSAQTKTGIWCDESWELIFPVGWGKQNGWKVVANTQYLQHCEQITSALAQGRRPDYMPFDAMPEIFAWYKNEEEEASTEKNFKQNKAEWEVGMKFECLDPLNETFLELKVATCIEILKDGYLKVGFDGPDMETEAIPFHCTSPYLFPIHYAKKYGIKLDGPLDDMRNFCWEKYIKQCQGSAAPDDLFDKVPSPNEMEEFKIGSKLEATDQCESNLICPATVRAVRGRLLQIHFDGWGNDYDQLFDYRSRDLFPLGWCEMYGYKLEIPQNDELLSARKKK
uniref:Mbt repeat protein n=1 Tax=Meloidogyne incognita TaxID=6306 RepID=A0A914KHA6_MELIC